MDRVLGVSRESCFTGIRVVGRIVTAIVEFFDCCDEIGQVTLTLGELAHFGRLVEYYVVMSSLLLTSPFCDSGISVGDHQSIRRSKLCPSEVNSWKEQVARTGLVTGNRGQAAIDFLFLLSRKNGLSMTLSCMESGNENQGWSGKSLVALSSCRPQDSDRVLHREGSWLKNKEWTGGLSKRRDCADSSRRHQWPSD